MLLASHLRVPGRDRAILAAVVTLLAAVAWVALWAWEASPYGRYLHHEAPAGLGIVAEAALFGLGWVVMTVAMMLPTTIRLLATFGALVGRRPHPGTLVALAMVGYLVTWTAVGLALWIGDRGVHLVVAAVPALAENPRIVLAATLAVAGAYQFSSLKYRCLDECRSPLGFVLNRWQGVAPAREALRLGVAHGLFCVGCCWSLMFVLFGVGLGSLGWMLVIGALTAIEKNSRWGRQIGRPLGVALLVAGLAILNG